MLVNKLGVGVDPPSPLDDGQISADTLRNIILVKLHARGVGTTFLGRLFEVDKSVIHKRIDRMDRATYDRYRRLSIGGLVESPDDED